MGIAIAKGLFIIAVSAVLTFPVIYVNPFVWVLIFFMVTATFMWVFRTVYICGKCGVSSYLPRELCHICGSCVATHCFACGKKNKNKTTHCERCGSGLAGVYITADMLKRAKNTLEANDFIFRDNGTYIVSDTKGMENILIYGRIVDFMTVVTLVFSCVSEKSSASVKSFTLLIDGSRYEVYLNEGITRREIDDVIVETGFMSLHKTDLLLLRRIGNGNEVYYLCDRGVDNLKVDISKEAKNIILKTAEITLKINMILKEIGDRFK